MNNSYIKLKEYINERDYNDIQQLKAICCEHDNVTLKLELEYKLNLAREKSGDINSINEFMYYEDKELVGYLGICEFGGDAIEVNGMVHPDYRRQGIFKKLYSCMVNEWMNRDKKSMLLLSDHESVPGLQFIKSVNGVHEHSEYEMYLTGKGKEPEINHVVLRKAANSDAIEIKRQDDIYFKDDETESQMEENIENEEIITLPEDEEKRGFITYIAMVGNDSVGKVKLELQEGAGGVYGLGVLPEHRRKGYGREILMSAVKKLKENNAKSIMLQVAVKNENALNLYRSCGFEKKSTMDYYMVDKNI